MSDQEHYDDPGRFTDRERLDQARYELSWVTSVHGKEAWATDDLINELRRKVRTFEHKVRTLDAVDEVKRIRAERALRIPPEKS